MTATRLRIAAVLLLTVLFMPHTASAQKGVYYEPTSDTECQLLRVDNKVEFPLVIPENVQINGRTYRVTAIGERAFREARKKEKEWCPAIQLPPSIREVGDYAFCCNFARFYIPYMPESLQKIGNGAFKNLSTKSGGFGLDITLPSSCTWIGVEAFCNASIRSINIQAPRAHIGKQAFSTDWLETAIVPDVLENDDDYDEANMGWDELSIFRVCERLKKVEGHHITFPGWVEKQIMGAWNNPAKKEVEPLKAQSYGNYAYHRQKELMAQWEQQDEFETTAQWQQRLTPENRRQAMADFGRQMEQEFVEARKPSQAVPRLGRYDADGQVFTIDMAPYGECYLSVPIGEMQTFREQFSPKAVSMEYGVVDDRLTAVACTYEADGRRYTSPTHYTPGQYTADVLTPLTLDLSSIGGTAVSAKSDIDTNIPQATTVADHSFAVVIGNEHYQRVSPVAYAQNDARSVATYCRQTLGMPEKNVRLYEDATYGTMLAAVRDIKSIAQAFGGRINVLFYYAGHGLPDETTGEPFLMPVDADGRHTEVCYPVARLYDELAALGANSVTVLLDACFSGAQRGEGMLASARGVALKAKLGVPRGNMVVFSAATGDETAYPYTEKEHGIFTYYLLKKLQETKGECTLGELGEYVQNNVRQQSVVVNRKSQTPTIMPAEEVINSWKTQKLK